MGSRLREEGEKLALVMYMSKIFLGSERECLPFVETVCLMLYVAVLKKTIIKWRTTLHVYFL